MADYSHLNLKDDVENAAEKFGLAPDMETRFGRNVLGLQGGGFSYQKLAPNVVLAGSGKMKLADEVRELKQWDAIRVAPTLARAFAAGPDGMELLAIGFGQGGEASMIEQPWADG